MKFFSSRVTVNIWLFTRTFWSTEAPHLSLWYFAIWCGCCVISLPIRWEWTTNSFCFQVIIPSRKRVCSIRHGYYFLFVTNFMFICMVTHLQFTLITNHYITFSTLAKPSLLWLLLEHSNGHYSWAHISILFLTGQGLRWPMLIWLPLPEMPKSVPTPGETVLLMQGLQTSPLTFNQLKQWTTQDPVLSRVHKMLLKGWPELKPYQVRHNELTICDGCVMWGNRIVVPQAGHKRVMEQLHDGNPGVSRMKSLAQSFVLWPRLDDDIADRVKSCIQCQQSCHAPQPAPLHPWSTMGVSSHRPCWTIFRKVVLSYGGYTFQVAGNSDGKQCYNCHYYYWTITYVLYLQFMDYQKWL